MTHERRQADNLAYQITNLPKSMPIGARPGDLVRFTGVGGHRWQVEEASEVLELGQVYLVHTIEIEAKCSYVVLHEGRFNTAMFEKA